CSINAGPPWSAGVGKPTTVGTLGSPEQERCGTMPDPYPDDGAQTEQSGVSETPGLRTESCTRGSGSGLPAGSGTATGSAPAYRPPAAAAPGRGPAPLLGLPTPGQRLDDFELLAVLGSGSFATVYLARQMTLDRLVALKVSANRGQEARTLASLEHDHIVRVFAEVVDQERDLRLLCMQYVPGTTLEQVIRVLARRDRRQWNGLAILEAIDASSTHPAPFDPVALRDREFL